MDFSKIVSPLLSWYGENARVLPWRDHPAPYQVWISEIMLQQTRVEAVKPYFERFMREIPDIRSLADIPEDKLLKIWEGLGYYSRARNLKKAAQVVLRDFGGKLPKSAGQLKTLPGIGDYTAGAVASIAYGLPEPAVDGNVLRVAARLSASGRDISVPNVKKNLHDDLQKIYPPKQCGAFTQSLMELGATVCLPNGEPLCGQCPLSGLCEAHRTGQETIFPIKAKKPKRRKEDRTVFLLLCNGRAAVRKRPPSGLLADLWEFPNRLGKLSQKQAEEVIEVQGCKICRMEPLPRAKHIFSHVEWHMAGYLVHLQKPAGNFEWPEIPELFQKYAVPSAFHAYLKILKQVQK